MITLLIELFYYIINIKGYQKCAFIFKVIGMNSILIYMSGTFINWSYTTSAIFKWLGQIVGDPYNVVVMVICSLAVENRLKNKNLDRILKEVCIASCKDNMKELLRDFESTNWIYDTRLYEYIERLFNGDEAVNKKMKLEAKK